MVLFFFFVAFLIAADFDDELGLDHITLFSLSIMLLLGTSALLAAGWLPQLQIGKARRSWRKVLRDRRPCGGRKWRNAVDMLLGLLPNRVAARVWAVAFMAESRDVVCVASPVGVDVCPSFDDTHFFVDLWRLRRVKQERSRMPKQSTTTLADSF
jgi:hypothetical protein